MATAEARKHRDAPPTRRPVEGEIEQARDLCRQLGVGSADAASPGLRVLIRHPDGTESEAELPPLARTILDYVLAELAAGNGLLLSRLRPLLTQFEAARLLGVSPAHVTELMESGELPFQESDGLRRVVFEDLMAYKERDDETTNRALDEMVAINQELGLY